MLEFSNGISNDYKIYSSELESIIFDMTDRANELVKHFVGHFQDNALAVLGLYCEEEYDDFLNNCLQYSNVSFDDVWIDYHSQLYSVRNKLLIKAPHLTIRELNLLNFIEDTLGAVNHSYINTADLVIALDCPRNNQMVAHDRIFELFIPLLGKKGGYISL